MPEFIAPEWRMTAAHLAILCSAAAFMKVLSAAADPAPWREKVSFLALSPVFSISTWRRPAPRLRLAAGAACLAGSAAYQALLAPPLRRAAVPEALLAYASAVPLWLLVGAGGFIAQGYALALGRRLESIHDRPLSSRSLAEFWGRRWNRWMSDWLRESCFRPLRRRPALGIVAAFGASALLHELVSAVPLWLLYRRSTFGLMTAYFLLQAAGLLVERRWLRRRPGAARAWAWLCVLGPLPLVLNEASRRIFHFA